MALRGSCVKKTLAGANSAGCSARIRSYAVDLSIAWYGSGVGAGDGADAARGGVRGRGCGASSREGFVSGGGTSVLVRRVSSVSGGGGGTSMLVRRTGSVSCGAGGTSVLVLIFALVSDLPGGGGDGTAAAVNSWWGIDGFGDLAWLGFIGVAKLQWPWGFLSWPVIPFVA